jgi:hypothetical protein
MGQITTRTDALVSEAETGKMPASIVPIAAGCHPVRGCNPQEPIRFESIHCERTRLQPPNTKRETPSILKLGAVIAASSSLRPTRPTHQRSRCGKESIEGQFGVILPA